MNKKMMLERTSCIVAPISQLRPKIRVPAPVTIDANPASYKQRERVRKCTVEHESDSHIDAAEETDHSLELNEMNLQMPQRR